jgi:uncharacterized protein (TIGR02444 family)
LSLWDFAVEAYGRARVRAACLVLQDVHGQSVCLLLWRAWTLSERREITPADQAAVMNLVRPWETEVIAPLRSARRALRSPPPELRGADLHDLAGAVELAAERVLLEALERLTPSAGAVEGDWTDALNGLAAAWRPGTPASSIITLIDALRAA